MADPFFGRRWDAPLVDEAEQVPTPVGQSCFHCGEAVVDGDRGLIRTVVRQAGADLQPSREPVHAECDLIGVMGHQMGVCHRMGRDENAVTQEPLIRQPGHHGGIWSRVLDANRCVDDTAWRYHRDTVQQVGKCRRCNGALMPGEPYKVGAVTWYRAECGSAECDYETAAHGPRPEKPKKGA